MTSAPKTSVKVSGTWKEAKKIYVKISGTWKEITSAYVKISGVWKLIHLYSRFLYEGLTIGSSTVSRGTSHGDYENLAYIGVVFSGDSNSHTYTGFTWDSVADSDHAMGTQDNGDSEHRGVAIGMRNVGYFKGDYDYDKVFAATGLLNSYRLWFRLVGGGLVSYVTGTTSAGAAYPQTHTYSLLKDDFVVVVGSSRTTGAPSNFDASGMTLIYDNVSAYGTKVFIYQMSSDGTFSTTVTNTNKYQQWCHLIAVYRAGAQA